MKSKQRILAIPDDSPTQEFLATAPTSEYLYRVLLEQAPDGVFISDASGRYEFVNEEACRMLGYSHEELLQLSVSEVLVPNDHAASPFQSDQLRAGKPILTERHLLRKDRTQILVEISAKMLADGRTQAFVRDISERKQMEQSTVELAAIVRSSEDAIIGKSLDGIITSWNSGAVRVYGYSDSEVIGKPISVLVPADHEDEIPQILSKVRAGESVSAHETVRITKDGQIIHVLLSVSPIRDTDGQILGASTITRDIPALKRAEEVQRRYAERLAAINRLERITSSGIEIEPIYDSFVKESIALLPMDRIGIVLLSEDGEQWQIARQWTRHEPKILPSEWRPVADSVMEWLVTNQIPFVELEIKEHAAWPEMELLRREGMQSNVVLPLIVQKQVVGALTVASRESAAYSEEDQIILTAIADQLAIAVYNSHLLAQVQRHTVELEQVALQRTAQVAQLEAANTALETLSDERTRAEEALRRYAERLAAINRLERITSSGIEIEPIYDSFVKESIALLPMDRIGIVLLSEDGEQWQIARQWTRHEPMILPSEWRPVADSVMEWLVTNQIPFVELEIKEHAAWPEMELLRREGMQSNVVLPLIVQKQVVGALTVASRDPAAYSEEDQIILTAIADQLAIAVYNSHLLAQVQRHTVELEQVALQRTAQVAQLEAANTALEILGDERTRAEEALRRYAERLAAINRLERITSSGIEIEPIYDSFVKESIALLPMDRIGIVLLNESGEQWQIARQWTRHEPKILPSEWRPVAGSVMEWLVTNQIPFVELEIKEHAAWSEMELLRHEGMQSNVVLPLIVQKQVVGALTVASRDPAAYSEEDQTVLTAIADQLAIAVYNSHLNIQIRNHAVELEQRVLQRTAELEAANKELEAFSYSVSHDLRAPLRGIDGYARILLRDYASLVPEDGQRRLQALRDMAQRMGKLIDDFLAFSRLNRQSLLRQPVNMGELVKEVLEDLKIEIAQRQVEFVVGELPDCQADPSLLKQVLTNLLSNALKYTGPRPIARIEVGTLRQNGALAYFVRDNGVGFDMKYIDKLFGVFQRLHRPDEFEGTGVGLAIVQRIINRHGGRVWAEAAPDAGATFFFTVGGDLANDGK